MSVCPYCNKSFKDDECKKIHVDLCKKSLRKCKWIDINGKKCGLSGKYLNGYCKRHVIVDFVYDDEGIKSSSCDSLEGCGYSYKKSIKVTSKKDIEDNSSLNFIYRGNRYTYISSSLTTITMKNIETNENELFWTTRDARKTKQGFLLSNLRSEEYDFYCEEVALCKIDDEYYCSGCFESVFKASIDILNNIKI